MMVRTMLARVSRRASARGVGLVGAVLLGACQPADGPVRSTEATVNAAVPDFRTGSPRVDVAAAEVVVGQSRGGTFQSYGQAAVTAAQFGQRVSVPVKLDCGTELGCTVIARVRLLADGGAPFDSSDSEAFRVVGGDAREVSGFALRTVRRIAPLETLTVAPLNGTGQLPVAVYDDADRLLARRVLTWSSADPTVASVDSLGRVTGRRPGRTSVSASAGAARVTMPVVVNTVQSFTLAASATRVMSTLTVRLTPFLTVGPGVSQRVGYRSSDTTVAAVSDNGTVSARKAGVVTITGIAEADSTQQRTVSITVDPFRAASTYTGVQVLSRGEVSSNIHGLWGERSDNIAAVGCFGVNRWNGSSWRLEQALGFCAFGVTGTAENNMFTVGSQIWRYNGTTWTRETHTFSGELYGAVAVDGVIYAVGTSGQIHRRTAGGWSSMTSPAAQTLRDVSGVTADNIWAVGDGGWILRFNGTTWQAISAPGGQFWDCRAVHVRGPNDVLATCNERNWGWSIQRWNGSAWTRMLTPEREFITDIIEVSGRMWAVGNQRTIYRQEGDGWVRDAERLGDVPVVAIYGDARGMMAVGNEGMSMTRASNGTWTFRSGYPLYTGMWVGGPDLIVAGGSRGAIDMFDGTRWVSSRPIGEHHGIRAVWGAARDAIFAVGPFATMLHYNGTQWQPQSVPTTAWISGVWGVRRDSVWAVTSNGEILFYDGTQWSLKFRTGRNLRAIHGRTTNNIVVAGDEGRIWRFDGRLWQREESNTDVSIAAVYVAPTRTFAVSGGQIFEHRNGEWRDPVVFSNQGFNWITGSGDTDVYVGGCGALTRRFDGTAWSAEVPTNLTQCTFSGTVVPGGGLVIGGANRDIISGTGPAGNTPGRAP